MITENIVVTRDFSWIDIEKPLYQDFEFISEEYSLPPLLMQNYMLSEQLPKYERSGDGHYFLLRVYDPWDKTVNISIPKITNKLAIFIKDNNVTTMHSGFMYPLKKYIELREKGELPQDSKKLVYHLFMLSIISFEEALMNLQRDYEDFEIQILAEEDFILSNKKIYEFRRKTYVLKGILQMTQRTFIGSTDFWKDCSHYKQSIKENIEQLIFLLDSLAQNFDQLFGLHISIYERKNNEVMKVLTVFASIMLPLTFISSFYGMNFVQMPGLKTSEGFVGTLILMATITFITVWFFLRKNWFKSHSM